MSNGINKDKDYIASKRLNIDAPLIFKGNFKVYYEIKKKRKYIFLTLEMTPLIVRNR